MAPPRKQKRAASARPGREYKLRLPSDIGERIEKKAAHEQRPQNRIIINELGDYPRLEKLSDLATLVTDMETVLARYGARITWHDLSDELLAAVDAVLTAEAQGGTQASALDRLRVVRTGMLKTKG